MYTYTYTQNFTGANMTAEYSEPKQCNKMVTKLCPSMIFNWGESTT